MLQKCESGNADWRYAVGFPGGLSPPSVGCARRVAVRSPMSGASLRRRRRPRVRNAPSDASVGRSHRRACASLAASFAAGVRELALERMTRSSYRRAHRHLPRAAPARCGAFADERRIVAGDGGGRVRSETLIQSRGSAAPPTLVLHVGPAAAKRVDGSRRSSGSQAGARTDTRSSHRRAHRHLPLRCARALRRVRR